MRSKTKRELLEVLCLACGEIRRFSDLPRCFPINRSVLPRLRRMIERLQPKAIQEPPEKTENTGQPAPLPLPAPVHSVPAVLSPEDGTIRRRRGTSWMLPPRQPLARRGFKKGSAVPERIARIEAFLRERESATVGELAVHLSLGDIKVRHALESGPFVSDNGWPARYRLSDERLLDAAAVA